MKHYFNKEAFTEGLTCLLFACSLFYLVFTGKYLLFVRPRMKIYLYFSAIVMVIWSISCFRRVPIPQYKMHLNRFLVLAVPMLAMFLPYTAIKASETAITSQMQTNQSDGQNDVAQNAQQSKTNVQNTPDTMQNTSSQDEVSNSVDSNQQVAASETQKNDQQNSQEQTSNSQNQQPDIPSGFDAENKTITISDTEFYAWLVQLNCYPDQYEGYTLHIHGTVYRDDSMEENEFAVTRLLMSCCVADLANCGPLCFYDNASELTQDAWVNVTGTYHYDRQRGMEITVTGIEDAEPSEEEYVYPTF